MQHKEAVDLSRREYLHRLLEFNSCFVSIQLPFVHPKSSSVTVQAQFYLYKSYVSMKALISSNAVVLNSLKL